MKNHTSANGESKVWKFAKKEFIDLNGPRRLIIEDNGIGFLEFGAVEAEVDSRFESVGGVERLEFSFEGEDEGDPVSGRGWAVVIERKMNGRIYFHMGESSDFTAKIG